jgi:cytochrome c-type biogenesis protein CcmH
MRRPRPARIACAALLCAVLGVARAEPSLDEREARLSASLRCLVCQNQSLADSTAPLAADLRRLIRAQLAQGRSEDQVKAFLEQRYGAFVRYDPPFAPVTWLLWLGPFALLAAGFATLGRALARRARAPVRPLTPAERARADALLREDAP